jgi:hypothetical protein
MSRRFLTVAAFLWAMIGLSQFSTAQVVTGTYNGVPLMNGTTTIVQGTGPTTPVITFAAPAPTAGISNEGRAGISNSAPLPSTFAASNYTVVYYSQPGTQPMTTQPGAAEGAGPAATTPANAAPEAAPPEGAAAGGSEQPESGGRAFNDLGPSSFINTVPSASSESLGQIAAQYKAKASLNARTLTNQDVQQILSSKPGVTVAKNMPPLGPSAMPSGLTQGGASTSQPQSAPATAPTAQSTTPAAQPVQSGTTGTPPPAAATQGEQPAGTAATAGATTTPQINPNQQSNDAQGKSKLPSTATFLPLLGLLGLVSGGIGLLVRKFRR